MTVINPNRSAISPVGSQHPTTSAHPSSSMIIRRTGSRHFKTHARYFPADGNLDLQLDDGTVYRVHRHFFTQYSSAFAAEYLSSPASSSFVRLRSIEGRDFDRFLSLIYPSKIGELDISTADEWLSVLRLADRWSFIDLRKLAREKLDSMALTSESAAAACESGGAECVDSARLGSPKAATVNTPERSGSSDPVDAVENLQRVQASILESSVEGSPLDSEDASSDIGDLPAPLGATPIIEATHRSMALHTALEPSSITRELVSTIDFLRELPFGAWEQAGDVEPAHNSEAPARHRESIQDRLQRVLGREPPKRTPSLWSSFRSSRSDSSDGAPSSSNAPAVGRDQDPAAESDNLDSCSASLSLRISQGPSLDAQDHPQSPEDPTCTRAERIARRREELAAGIIADTERVRDSMNRAVENASRWMDIFGRTTYSSAFYGE